MNNGLESLAKSSRLTRSRGFTIIELLIALSILAIVTAATTPILITTMRINADNRVRAQAVAATEVWLDRFRAKSLDFATFSSGVTFDYGHDYGADATFVAAGDPDPAALNAEWQAYSFTVKTETFTTSPLLWRVEVETRYDRTGNREASLNVATIIEQ